MQSDPPQTAQDVCAELVAGRLSVGQAVAELRRPLDQAYSQQADLEDAYWRLWHAVVTTAAQTSSQQQTTLIAVLKALEHDVLPVDGQLSKRWGQTGTLPLFGAQMREQLDQVCEEAATYANYCSWAARISREGIDDYTMYGMWALRSALEDMPCDRLLESVSFAAVSGAVAWLVHGSPLLWQGAKINLQFPQRCGLRGAGLTDDDLPMSTSGLSVARWQLWKARWKALETSQFPTSEIKRLSVQAQKAMQVAEEQDGQSDLA